ncbi:MAG: TetR/AcrR family transcriptional regulator [Pirellula sp.]|nr:TetR/AcrR family transcriptional regulator [Pirellula sp.]
MVELTRKQRELERRAAEILAVAKPILINEGFQALSMDRVAAQMEYAKGTIYNHFPNKEEIVLALLVSTSRAVATTISLSSSSFGTITFGTSRRIIVNK